jgi:hypothetical protein
LTRMQQSDYAVGAICCKRKIIGRRIERLGVTWTI